MSVLLAGALVLSALPASAAGWPSIFNAYGRFDGTTFNDPIDEPSGNDYGDLSSGTTAPAVAGPLSSVYVAADGTDLLVRFRLRVTPGLATGPGGWNASKGGLTGFAYVVQLSVAGTHVASVGLDGKSASADYVYVAPVSSITTAQGTYTASSPRVVSTWNSTTQEIPGARITNAANADAPLETFLDFRVPIADITLVAPSITASTPLQFFFGSSAAANLTTINKDYMSGGGTETCLTLGCAELSIGPSDVGLAWTATPTSVSGPNPPTVGTESRYDLTIRASNTGLNTLSQINISDELPPHVAVVSADSGSGAIAAENGVVTWEPTDLAPGQRAEAKVRVAVRPDGSWHNKTMVLSNGPTATARDAAAERNSAASLSAVSVSPVSGLDAASDFTVSMSGPASATAGEDLIHVVDVANLGPAPATPRASIVLPAGVAFASATGAGWSCSGSVGQVECSQEAPVTVGTAAPALTITTKTAPDASGSVVLSTTAAPVDGTDQNGSNDTAAVTTVITPAEEASEQPSPPPTDAPTEDATEAPTEDATEAPTEDATEAPTEDMSETPTEEASELPTEDATEAPSEDATETPTEDASELPTEDATEAPSEDATETPTEDASELPTEDATEAPTEDASETPEPTEEFAPLAVDDQAGGTVGEAVTVDVLANDSAPGSALDPASVTVIAPMQHGEILAVDSTTGAVRYQPDATYEGADEFSYRVCNLRGRCASATVRTATPPVDLEVTVVRTGPALVLGATATYDVTVTNLGPRHADGPLTLRLSAPAGLTGLSANGSGWTLDAEATTASSSARVTQLSVAAASTATLYWPGGLPVSERSTVSLSGAVSGAAGSDVRLVAEVSGPDIELEYANNESSALDVVASQADPAPPGGGGPTDPDPTNPADPVDPSDPADPDDPGDPVDPGEPQDPHDPLPPADEDPDSGGEKRPPTDDIDHDSRTDGVSDNTDGTTPSGGGVQTNPNQGDAPHLLADPAPRALPATGGGSLWLLATATALSGLGIAILRVTGGRLASPRRDNASPRHRT